MFNLNATLEARGQGLRIERTRSQGCWHVAGMRGNRRKLVDTRWNSIHFILRRRLRHQPSAFVSCRLPGRSQRAVACLSLRRHGPRSIYFLASSAPHMYSTVCTMAGCPSPESALSNVTTKQSLLNRYPHGHWSLAGLCESGQNTAFPCGDWSYFHRFASLDVWGWRISGAGRRGRWNSGGIGRRAYVSARMARSGLSHGDAYQRSGASLATDT